MMLGMNPHEPLRRVRRPEDYSSLPQNLVSEDGPCIIPSCENTVVLPSTFVSLPVFEEGHVALRPQVAGSAMTSEDNSTNHKNWHHKAIRRNLSRAKDLVLFVGSLPRNLSNSKYTSYAAACSKTDKSSIGPVFPSIGCFFITFLSSTSAAAAHKSFKENPLQGEYPELIFLPYITVPRTVDVHNSEPLLVFINCKSGGGQGRQLYGMLLEILNGSQIFLMEKGGAMPGLFAFRKLPKFRVLVCGGDGTVGWVLSHLEVAQSHLMCSSPPVAILPVGTGNDLARVLGFGSGWNGENIDGHINQISDFEPVKLDRWNILFDATIESELTSPDPLLVSDAVSFREEIDGVRKPVSPVNIVMSIGGSKDLMTFPPLDRKEGVRNLVSAALPLTMPDLPKSELASDIWVSRDSSNKTIYQHDTIQHGDNSNHESDVISTSREEFITSDGKTATFEVQHSRGDINFIDDSQIIDFSNTDLLTSGQLDDDFKHSNQFRSDLIQSDLSHDLKMNEQSRSNSSLIDQSHNESNLNDQLQSDSDKNDQVLVDLSLNNQSHDGSISDNQSQVDSNLNNQSQADSTLNDQSQSDSTLNNQSQVDSTSNDQSHDKGRSDKDSNSQSDNSPTDSSTSPKFYRQRSRNSRKHRLVHILSESDLDFGPLIGFEDSTSNEGSEDSKRSVSNLSAGGGDSDNTTTSDSNGDFKSNTIDVVNGRKGGGVFMDGLNVSYKKSFPLPRASSESAVLIPSKERLSFHKTMSLPVTTRTVPKPTDDVKLIVMSNYFGIGIDAELTLAFHLAREENPGKCTSRMRNKALYFKAGLKKMTSRSVNLNHVIDLEVNNEVIHLPSIRGLIFLNIGSWAGGANAWGSPASKRFRPPSFGDGLVEIIGVSGVAHMSQIYSGIRSGVRIAQGEYIKMTLKAEVAVQIDGEPWMQPPGKIVISVSPQQATMLKKTKKKSK